MTIASHTIDHWLKVGLLIPKHRGVYRLGHEAVPEFSDELAAVMACAPQSLLGDGSAAYLWRILPTSPFTATVSVIVVGRDVRSRPGICVRRLAELPGGERTIHQGVPVTTPARTLLDLAAVVNTRTLERALNEAQVLRLTTPRALLPLLARHPRHRGARALRALVTDDRATALTRSEAERRLLALIAAAGLPRPRSNARLRRYEVDFLWAEQRLVVEVDGFRYHSSRAAFERDRARDAELAGLGYRVIRVTWRQIVNEPYVVVARIAQALGSA